MMCSWKDQILQGSLTETRYTWPDHSIVSEGKPSPPRVLKETTFDRDQVFYMSDKVSNHARLGCCSRVKFGVAQLGLHKITNPDPKSYAVSLHC